MTSHTSAAPSEAASTVKSRAIAVGAATLAAVLVWGLGKAFGAEYEVAQGDGKDPMEVNAGLVIVFALLSSLLGWGLLVALEKFLPAKAATVWGVVAVVVLLASYGMVFSADTTGGTKTALALVHTAVGAVLIPLLLRGARRSA
ncbi:DUF6069 family protein [Streptomyces cyanogenus]|uniref:Uncharacterized protein n=1 Tax=Streptomyces cyanogenus TaxID=80860 RepID=A0ABX7THM6_STRCY|nr:DUF6069 family protein [Streptomyces cyanogenus]QTD95921.1 hypothetical protein S1361_01120 [Streptomyces cyanogenus]